MHNSQPGKRIAYFPISFFAMIMGLCGLGLAWRKFQHVYEIDLGINLILVSLISVVFTFLASIYLYKIFKYRHEVWQELQHPVKLSFFPSISISLILLGTLYLHINHTVSLSLWLVGTGLHLSFTLYVVNTWMHQPHFKIQHMNPAWFIPAVGNVLVPIAGVPLGFIDTSWFFFSVGMLFWIILMVIVFYRIMFHDPIEARLLPSLFILIAPPAIGFIAYMRLQGDQIDPFARFLYFSGLFITLLHLTQVHRFARLQFALSWWAYSFPTAAVTTATLVMYELSGGKPFYLWVGIALLTLLTLLIGLLLVRTFKAARAGKICVPH